MADRETDQRIAELEKENEALKAWQGEVNKILGRMLEMLEDQKKADDDLRTQIATVYQTAKINRYRIDSIPYEIAAAENKVDISFPRIMSISETREKIVKEGMSIARLGDGEFSAIAGNSRWNFQDPSIELGERMKEVLTSDNPKLLIGLNPNFYKALFDLKEEDADGVRAYMRPMVRRLHDSLLDDRIYADGLFHRLESDEDVRQLKEIWSDRNVTLIEGQYTRMGVGNDLLDGARQIKRILAPSENAFSFYQEIFDQAARRPEGELFLIALGPTATVLSYDLCKAGYQAIDIGHLDLIYEKYIRGLSSLYEVKIPYKYCNSDEIGDRRQIEEIHDPVYESQIIARVGL